MNWEIKVKNMKGELQMRQIATVVIILIVCIFACGLANSTSRNDTQGKWEYCTLACIKFPTSNKPSYSCAPLDAIPDFNSVGKPLESATKLNSSIITDFLNAFGNYGWELITITEQPKNFDVSETDYIFKRHK
jgi:hypothetical protein